MNMENGFIERHGLWSTDQFENARELKLRIEEEDLHLVRLAWVDSHGAVRAKAITIPVFISTLIDGYNINVATSTLDGSGGRVFRSFTRGGGMGLDEMTGSPNIVAVPVPETFRVLPWAPGVGWILCDQYFKDGHPFHFSTRNILKNQLAQLDNLGYKLMIGLEVEWYLTRICTEEFSLDNVGLPGRRGSAISTLPVEPGYSYHSETNFDIMQPVLSELVMTYEELNLPLRSMENEWGPGQVETTLTVQQALDAADSYVLMRTATRQICRRRGFLASFMCRPAIQGYYSSGWHLHQSLTDAKTGKNLFMPDQPDEPLSLLGNYWLAGLLDHAQETAVFTTPTVNGYRRFQPNSLAPDRVCWGIDHRGTMLRVLSGKADSTSRLENRMGEPAANPYLFIASQIIAGIDGIKRKLVPPAAVTDPYNSDCPMLPGSLETALDTAANSKFLKQKFGSIFIDYFVKLKQSELKRFNEYCLQNKDITPDAEVTQWEQDEYFDFF